MRQEDLQNWLENPELIDEQATDSLESALRDFPYSAVLQQLYLMGLENQKSYLATAQLKKTSMWSPNRSLLKTWLEQGNAGDDWNPEPSKRRVEAPAPPKPVQPKEDQKPATPEVEAQVEKVESSTPESVPQPTPEPPAAEKPKPITSTPPKVVHRPTELGDDLSHLSPRVRAIVEKSRAIRSNTSEEEESKPVVAKTSPNQDKPQEPVQTAEEVREAEQPSAPKPIAPIQHEPAKIEIEEVPEPPVEEVQENFEIHAEVEESIEEEPVDETVEEDSNAEERHFPRPIILDELTAEEEDEDDPIQLDFSAWLRMKQGIKPEVEAEEKVEVSTPEPIEFELPEEEEEPKEEPKEKVNKMKLIDRFLEDQPKITPRKKEDKYDEPQTSSRASIDVSAMGSEVGDDFITETLAQVYKQQGYLDKAISAYEILSLKYPEKSSFFADQISEIRRLKRRSGK